MGIAYNPQIVTDGLVLCLDAANKKSYPGSGSTWKDIAGGDNNGTIQGPGFVNSNKGGFSFNGTTNYVTLPNNTLRTLQTLTVSSWVKFNQVNANNCLITNPQNGSIGVPWVSPYATWKLGIRKTGGEDYIEMSVGSGQTFYEKTTKISSLTGSDISTSTTYNIVASHNSSLGDDGFKFYVNGSKAPPPLLQGGGIWSLNCVISQPILVGTDHGGNYVNGTIYNTSVYNRVLTDAEITQNFNALRGRFGI
jgi:hypothetical protein